MIIKSRHTLSNGLRIVYNRDNTSNFVTVNVLYNVGARDESPELTGLAHLFEHLMFGGSANIPDFDTELQKAGGESNAWTDSDYTNYYDVLPIQNIETAFWLEADRMRKLAFTDESLEIQRSVVIEEFKERCLNTPYGDIGHILRSNSFKNHPYRWPVIGKAISHIENVTMAEVKDFFFSHYCPNNAVLSVVGNIDFEEVVLLVEKYFGDIMPYGNLNHIYPQEQIVNSINNVKIARNVPQDMIVMGFSMCNRFDKDYYTYDIISDILANGQSSRFYSNIVSKSKSFISLDASILGSMDPGLFLIQGRLLPDEGFDCGLNLILNELNVLCNSDVLQSEIDKCVNKFESKELFGILNQQERAYKLAYCEMLNNVDLINNEHEFYREIKSTDIQRIANDLLNNANKTIIFYGNIDTNA